MSIFQKLNRVAPAKNIVRLKSLFMEQNSIILERGYKHYEYTLFEFVDKYCFKNWRGKGDCIDATDMLDSLDYEKMCNDAAKNVEALKDLIELIYNFWELAYHKLCDFEAISSCAIIDITKLAQTKELMDKILLENKCVATVDEKEFKVHIADAAPSLQMLEEYAPKEVVREVAIYNYRSSKGNLKEKRNILYDLSREIEPYRKELSGYDAQLSRNIFDSFNNLNIRHNNVENSENTENSHYHPNVAQLNESELEELYDTLCKMVVYAWELISYKRNSKKIREQIQMLSEKASSANGGTENGQT